MKRIDVLGVGYCAIDYLGIVPGFPEIDEKAQLSELIIQGGGITATAMAAVGRLGGRAAYVGPVGDDGFGRFIVEELQRDGVDTSGVIIRPGKTSQFSFVVVDQPTGKRTIFWTNSGLTLMPEDIRKEDVLSAKVLQIDAHFPEAALQAAEWANEAGIPVVIDAGSMKPMMEDLLERTDYIIASELFARQITGKDNPENALKTLFTGRCKLAAVTLGGRGCIYTTNEGKYRQPAFKVEVVDTTGAGDVFHGAFSYGLSQGWDNGQIIEFASAVSAMKCTKLGGRTGIPTIEQVKTFILNANKS